MKVNLFRQSDKNLDTTLEKLDPNTYAQYEELLNLQGYHNNGFYDVLYSDDVAMTTIILWDGWNGEFIDLCLSNLKKGEI